MVTPTCSHSVNALLAKLNNKVTLVNTIHMVDTQLMQKLVSTYFQLKHTSLNCTQGERYYLSVGGRATKFELSLLPDPCPLTTSSPALVETVPRYTYVTTKHLLYSSANTHKDSAHVHYLYNKYSSTDLDRSALHLPILVQVAKES